MDLPIERRPPDTASAAISVGAIAKRIVTRLESAPESERLNVVREETSYLPKHVHDATWALITVGGILSRDLQRATHPDYHDPLTLAAPSEGGVDLLLEHVEIMQITNILATEGHLSSMQNVETLLAQLAPALKSGLPYDDVPRNRFFRIASELNDASKMNGDEPALLTVVRVADFLLGGGSGNGAAASPLKKYLDRLKAADD